MVGLRELFAEASIRQGAQPAPLYGRFCSTRDAQHPQIGHIPPSGPSTLQHRPSAPPASTYPCAYARQVGSKSPPQDGVAPDPSITKHLTQDRQIVGPGPFPRKTQLPSAAPSRAPPLSAGVSCVTHPLATNLAPGSGALYKDSMFRKQY